jgi:hypothetical protein
MSWSMIARIISVTTCVSVYSPPSYKHLILIQVGYIHVKGNSWFHLWWMEILETLQHTQHISLYIFHTKVETGIRGLFSEEFSFHFTVCLLTDTSIDVNKTGMRLCILLKQICNLGSLVIKYHTINKFPKWDSASLIAHIVTHFLHMSVHFFSENYDTWLQEYYQ